MGLKLVGSGESPTPALTDIPGKLRLIADHIESGESPCPQTMLWVGQYDDGSVAVGSLGEFVNKFEAVGILTLGTRIFTHGATSLVHT